MIVLIAAMIAAQQAPAAADPGQTGAPIDVTADKKKKPKQHCQLIDVSGSRMRQRVCVDDYGTLVAGPNVTDAGSNPGMLHAIPGPDKGGLGGVPK